MYDDVKEKLNSMVRKDEQDKLDRMDWDSKRVPVHLNTQDSWCKINETQ